MPLDHPPSLHPQGDHRKYLLHSILPLPFQLLFPIEHITVQIPPVHALSSMPETYSTLATVGTFLGMSQVGSPARYYV